MTERAPSQNKQILEKVNEALDKIEVVSEKVGDMGNDISAIKKELELRPKMDKSEHEKIDLEFKQHKESITKLENNQRWLVLAVLSIVVFALMQSIIK